MFENTWLHVLCPGKTSRQNHCSQVTLTSCVCYYGDCWGKKDWYCFFLGVLGFSTETKLNCVYACVYLEGHAIKFMGNAIETFVLCPKKKEENLCRHFPHFRNARKKCIMKKNIYVGFKFFLLFWTPINVALHSVFPWIFWNTLWCVHPDLPCANGSCSWGGPPQQVMSV